MTRNYKHNPRSYITDKHSTAQCAEGAKILGFFILKTHSNDVKIGQTANFYSLHSAFSRIFYRPVQMIGGGGRPCLSSLMKHFCAKIAMTD